MIRKSFLVGLLLVSSLFAECRYAFDSHKIEWTAFKTPQKVGVKGGFAKSSLEAVPHAKVQKLLESATLSVETYTVDSGNEGRDALLKNSFFAVQGVEGIKVKTLEVNENEFIVAITMQGKTIYTTLAYTLEGLQLHAKGKIDLKDFGMLPSLESINKACYDLHEGKTWQDVDIAFSAAIKKECK